MARWISHKCNNCNYSFHGSGIPDALKRGPTHPVVCKGCNKIYDRIVGSDTEENPDLSCEDCGSDEFTKWDYKARKCPRCEEGLMDIADSGMITQAD